MKDPSKMSERELRLVAHAAKLVLESSGYGGYDLQDAYGHLRRVFGDDEKNHTEAFPDKDKLMVFAQVLREFEQPKLESEAGLMVMVSIKGWLKVICSDIESEADRL